MKNIFVAVDNKNVKVNAMLAESFLQKNIGLMFRKSGNMLFLMKKEKKHAFWMLFMRFSIDIIFINKNKVVVDVIKNVHIIDLNHKNCRYYKPKHNCFYVLEIDSNECKNIEIGDQLTF